MTKELHIGINRVTLVDDEDFVYLCQWNWGFEGRYAYRRDYRTGAKIYLHKVINKTPLGFMTDHINHDKLDNRKENLRTATRNQNEANKPKKLNCSSKYRGVCWHKQRSKWKAEIKVNQMKKHLGLFENEIEAAKAYDEAAMKAFGDYATLNFK